MRRIAFLTRIALLAMSMALTVLASPALSQTPPKLEPLPDVPPPPPEIANDPDLEPQVTIIKRDTETVEEVRVNGQLMYVKVTPVHGRPYFLVNDGNKMVRRDSLDTGLHVPLWLLFSF